MTGLDLPLLVLQAGKAIAYYLILIVIMRLAGKRLAGQTTTFDLLVLITLGVTVQSALIGKTGAEIAVFVITVFTVHRLLARVCKRSTFVRHLVRGRPRALVRDGNVIDEALDADQMQRLSTLPQSMLSQSVSK